MYLLGSFARRKWQIDHLYHLEDNYVVTDSQTDGLIIKSLWKIRVIDGRNVKCFEQGHSLLSEARGWTERMQIVKWKFLLFKGLEEKGRVES